MPEDLIAQQAIKLLPHSCYFRYSKPQQPPSEIISIPPGAYEMPEGTHGMPLNRDSNSSGR